MYVPMKKEKKRFTFKHDAFRSQNVAAFSKNSVPSHNHNANTW